MMKNCHSGRDRTGEVVTLGPLAAEVPEQGGLVAGFHTLGDRGQAEAGGQVDDRPDQHRLLDVGVVGGHERAVDLQHVDREVPQVGER